MRPAPRRHDTAKYPGGGVRDMDRNFNRYAIFSRHLTTGMIFTIITGGHLIARFLVLTDITTGIVDAISGSGLALQDSPRLSDFEISIVYALRAYRRCCADVRAS